VVQKWLKYFCMAVILSVLVVSVSGLGAKVGGTLTIALSKDPVTLDPTMALDQYSMEIIDQIFDRLVRFDQDGVLMPSLAVSWENPETTRWVFSLRKDVPFHNGRSLTAADVVWTMRRMMDPKTAAPRQRLYMVKEVKALDEFTVEFMLNEAFAPFLAILANPGLSIIPKEEVERLGDDFARNPVGSGPFKFVSWIQDKEVVLERFADYWAARPNLDKVIFRAIPETAVAEMAVLTGDVDAIEDVLPDDVEYMKSVGNLQVMPGGGYYYICINMHPERTSVYEKTGKNPFLDLRVRQALNLAFDIDEVLNAIYPGIGNSIRAYGILPPTSWAYNKEIEAVALGHDLERAKQLMAEAGYADGFECNILAMSDAARQAIAIIFQATLKKLNIEATIDSPEFGTLLQRANDGDFDLSVFGWSGSPDPHDYLYWLLHSNNWGSGGNNAFYKNAQVDELLDNGAAASTLEARKSYYEAAQAIVAEELPHIPLYWKPEFLATTSRVHDLQAHFQGWFTLVSPEVNVWVE